jgi:hypothetical protein
MSKSIRVIIVVVVSAAGGYAATLLWDTTTAGYIVGVAGTALGGIALALGPSDSRAKTMSKIRVRRAERSDVIGVDGTEGSQPVESDVRVGTATNSKIIGVKQRRP